MDVALNCIKFFKETITGTIKQLKTIPLQIKNNHSKINEAKTDSINKNKSKQIDYKPKKSSIVTQEKQKIKKIKKCIKHDVICQKKLKVRSLLKDSKLEHNYRRIPSRLPIPRSDSCYSDYLNFDSCNHLTFNNGFSEDSSYNNHVVHSPVVSHCSAPCSSYNCIPMRGDPMSEVQFSQNYFPNGFISPIC